MVITNILWDTEDNGEHIPQEELDLPSTVEIKNPGIDEDNVADWLSDTFGYCVDSFMIGRYCAERRK